MKRKLAISLLLVLVLSLALPLSASALSGGNLGYVTDSAGILTAEQQAELESIAAGISERYQCGVYIVTTQDYTEFGRGSIENCAREIFDRYLIGFGETGDGILFLVSMAERDFYIDVHGSFGNYAFPHRVDDTLDESFLPSFRENDWYGGFKAYLTTVEQLLVPAEREAEQEKLFSAGKGVGAVVVGLLSALGVTGGMKRKMKTAVEKRDADDYMTVTSPHMRVVQDHFLNRTRTVQVVQQESRSSGGHSGGGFSGHSGHGGKF